MNEPYVIVSARVPGRTIAMYFTSRDAARGYLKTIRKHGEFLNKETLYHDADALVQRFPSIDLSLPPIIEIYRVLREDSYRSGGALLS